MNLPFNAYQFINLFREYNLSIWPSQLIVYILGLIAVTLAFKRTKYSDKIILIILSVFWLCNGVFYHLTFFTKINKAAYLFGTLFVIQGILYFYYGLKNKVIFSPKRGIRRALGCVFIVYAAIIYPLLGYYLGHGYPYSPLLGVTPCPTTIFTFGLLLLANPAVGPGMTGIPLIWSLIGFNAALAFGIWEDTGLLASGLISITLLTYNRFKIGRAVSKGAGKCT